MTHFPPSPPIQEVIVQRQTEQIPPFNIVNWMNIFHAVLDDLSDFAEASMRPDSGHRATLNHHVALS